VSSASRNTTVVIVTELPFVPEQLSEYVVSCVIGPTLCEPEAAFDPVQPPDALHVLTLTPVHDSVEFVLRGTLRGFADNEIEGDPPPEATVTVAVRAIDPPLPEHVNVYDLLAVSAPVPCEPAVPFVPVHAPDAVHEVTFVPVHDSVDDPLEATDEGLAVSVSAGTEVPLFTVTATVFAMLPPLPLQLSV